VFQEHLQEETLSDRSQASQTFKSLSAQRVCPFECLIYLAMALLSDSCLLRHGPALAAELHGGIHPGVIAPGQTGVGLRQVLLEPAVVTEVDFSTSDIVGFADRDKRRYGCPDLVRRARALT
jgi:hypothetical protein